MSACPQLPFRVLMALAGICFFHIVINRGKILLYWRAKSLRNPNIPRCEERMRSNKGGTVLNFICIGAPAVCSLSVGLDDLFSNFVEISVNVCSCLTVLNGVAPDYLRNDFKYTPFPLTTRSGRGTFNPSQTVEGGGFFPHGIWTF